jgi:hypothetical protein|tara:strand:+ start:51040 stop:51990 length:951 start_codon:yes stop_codon:yes gene_type:complete
MEYNIYRLNNLKPISWQLPLKETFVKKFVEENGQKKDLGFRRIKYVPGTDTIFAEDIKGDLKPESIWFSKGELMVRKDDKLKNEILQKHPWYGSRYKLWSEDLENEQRLAVQRAKSEARKLIDDADMDNIKSIALAVFGPQAISWKDTKCELQLREEADTNPARIKDVINQGNYQAKLLAGLAFVKGVVRENTKRTAVIWEDSQGVIIKLAKGENGIEELGRFLSKNTEESQEVLQSIGDRVESLVTETQKQEDDKDAKIAELQAQLAALKNETDNGEELSELQEARDAYKAKFKKDVPNNMKNNLVWLQNRLSEE